MKKLNLKSKILLCALLLGSGAAVATTMSNLPNPNDPVYNWNGAGPNGSGTLIEKTVPQARDFYGCYIGTNPCATGELVSGSGPATVEIQRL